MQLNPYFHFNGDCEAAFKFYEQVLGGKIESLISHEGMPGASQLPAEWRSKIMHARMLIGEQAIMGMDAPPDRYQKPQGFHARRSRAHLLRLGRRRNPNDAHPGDLLVRPFRHASGPLRHPLDD